MTDILVIRSVSFQQLDQNLPRLQEAFPDAQITLLTHEHGVRMAEKYKAIQQVLVYPYKEGFRYRRKTPGIRNRTFDAVIIPVANISGTGFFNVLLFSLTVPAKRRYLCNMLSDIREVSLPQILALGIRNAMFQAASLVLTAIFGLFTLLLLPISLKRILKDK